MATLTFSPTNPKPGDKVRATAVFPERRATRSIDYVTALGEVTSSLIVQHPGRFEENDAALPGTMISDDGVTAVFEFTA